MAKIKWDPWSTVFGCITMVIVDQLFMLLGAILIDQGVLAYDAGAVWSILSVMISGLVSSFVCMLKFSVRLYSYISGVMFLSSIFISFLISEGECIKISVGTKLAIAMMVAVFLGNSAGGAFRISAKRTKKRANFRE